MEQVIKIWEEFETAVLELSRKWEKEVVGREEIEDRKEEIREIQRAYLKGADDDKVEKRLRRKQMGDMCFDSGMPHLFSNLESAKNRLDRVKAVRKSDVKKEMEEGEKRLKEIKEEERREKLTPKQLEKEKKTPEEKLMAKIHTGVVTDRVFNLLYNDEEKGMKIEGNFNYRVKWIHDIFTDRLMKDHVNSLPEIDESLFTFDQVDSIIQNFEEIRADLPKPRFSDREFRRITGLKHLSGEEICYLVDSYRKIDVKGTIGIYWDKENDTWTRVYLADNICGVLTKETGRISPRGSKPEHEYFFALSVAGFFLFHNLLRKKLTVLPTEFYRLKGGSQEIYRKVAQFKSTRYYIDTISRILGYQEKVRNLPDRKRFIDGYLIELKEKGFIKYWKREGRGKKTKYHIERV